MNKFFFTFFLGAIASWSMAPTNWWFVLFFSLSGLFTALQTSDTAKKAFAAGFGFSFGYFTFSLYWIGNALLVENNPYWWAWPLAVTGLPFILSFFTATAALLFYSFKTKNPYQFLNCFTFIILITLSEYARGHLFTGFPWNLYGYSWINIKPIAQVAALHDIYLLTALTILWATTPAFCISGKTSKPTKWFMLLFSLGTFSLSYAYGWDKIQKYQITNSDTKIILVQPNIKQSEKWDSTKRLDHFEETLKLSRNPEPSDTKTHIVLWPETAIAPDIMYAPQTKSMIQEMLATYSNDAYLITGALRNENDTYYNSILIFDKNANIIYTYDKSHLVPFGEYIPLSHIFDITPIVGFTGFAKGHGPETFYLNANISLSALVCYEIIFPSKTYDRTANQPSMIINVTNDAWYGDSPGPYQHLVQAQFRAIETGIPIFRSANTGISASINPLGQILESIPYGQNGVITKELPKTQ